jgi:hypothetical protein
MKITQIIDNHLLKHRNHEKKAVKLLLRVFALQSKQIIIFVNKYGIHPTILRLDHLIQEKPMDVTLKHIWRTVGKDYENLNHHLHTKNQRSHKDYIESYANSHLAAKKVKDITETTRKKVKDSLLEGAQKQLHKRDLADLIKQNSGFSKERSLLIARTETTMAANMGALTAAENSGANLEKFWIATNDARTREWHSEVDQTPIPMNLPFIVNGEEMQHPGDPNGSPENVCNCRCVLGFRPVRIEQPSENPHKPLNNRPLHGVYQFEVPNDTIAAEIASLITRLTEGENQLMEIDENNTD